VIFFFRHFCARVADEFDIAGEEALSEQAKEGGESLEKETTVRQANNDASERTFFFARSPDAPRTVTVVVGVSNKGEIAVGLTDDDSIVLELLMASFH
jgi:hypothetical protein